MDTRLMNTFCHVKSIERLSTPLSRLNTTSLGMVFPPSHPPSLSMVSPPLHPPPPYKPPVKKTRDGWRFINHCSVVLGHTVKTVCLQYSVIFITVQKLFIINISEVSVTTLKKVSKTESLLKI